MDLIGKDQLFELDILFPQPLHQISRLLERNIAVVVAVDQQDGRLPLLDRSHRRGIEGKLQRFLVIGSLGGAGRTLPRAVLGSGP